MAKKPEDVIPVHALDSNDIDVANKMEAEIDCRLETGDFEEKQDDSLIIVLPSRTHSYKERPIKRIIINELKSRYCAAGWRYLDICIDSMDILGTKYFVTLLPPLSTR